MTDSWFSRTSVEARLGICPRIIPERAPSSWHRGCISIEPCSSGRWARTLKGAPEPRNPWEPTTEIAARSGQDLPGTPQDLQESSGGRPTGAGSKEQLHQERSSHEASNLDHRGGVGPGSRRRRFRAESAEYDGPGPHHAAGARPDE